MSDVTRGWLRFNRTLLLRVKYQNESERDQDRLNKFNLPSKNRPNPLTPDEEDSFRPQLLELAKYRHATEASLTSALAAHRSRALVQHQRFNCSKDERDFMNRIIHDSTITCKPADKNLGLALVNTSWYDAELKRMLSDTGTYRRFRNDKSLTVTICNRAHENISLVKLKTLLYDELQLLLGRHRATLARWSGVPDDQVAKYIHSKIGKTTSELPQIYLLIKVHKPNGLCGRPIVPCTKWITTPASVLVDHLLQEILKAAKVPWIVKDTKSLVNEFETIHTSRRRSDMIFVTADIASLYTNISTVDGLKLIRAFLVEHDVPTERIDLIMDLLTFVMNQSFLTFKDIIYRQIDGTAMGTACAPTYANIFVFQLEKNIMHEFADSLAFYRRFLDDIFAYISADAADRFMARMNSLHPKLRFEFSTHPTEIAFLDLTIFKGERFHADGRFDLRVHQKKMNLYLYIPYLSYHTDATKRSFIQTELMRYIRNTSAQADYNSLKAVFYQRLRDRGYPHSFLVPIFESIHYTDREYFLYPSAELSSHPGLTARPPRSQCLLKRLARAAINARWSSNTHSALSPPVFIVPYTPLSHAVPTRAILSHRWDCVHAQLGLPRPIIAYQNFPSLMTKLVYSTRWTKRAGKSSQCQRRLSRRSIQSALPSLQVPISRNRPHLVTTIQMALSQWRSTQLTISDVHLKQRHSVPLIYRPSRP